MVIVAARDSTGRPAAAVGAPDEGGIELEDAASTHAAN